MAIRKLTPTDRVRDLQREDRVRRAQPRELAEDWVKAARAWARRFGVDVRRVLDTLDEQASIRHYAGEPWDAAQARAWSDTVELLTPRAA